MKEKKGRGWMRGAIVIFCYFALLVLSGCVWHGVAGDGCIFCDFVPSSAGTVITEPVSIPVAPAARFNGSAIVSLEGGLHYLRGEIFQALQTGCGLTQVDAIDERLWETAPLHDYRVKVSSSTSYAYGIAVVSASVIVSENTFVSPQRRGYRFVRNGSGTAYYGEWHDNYRQYRQSYDAALRIAVGQALAALCGYTPRDIHSGGIDVVPQMNFSTCNPPTCIEQTIGVYGTWGGYGINSSWPTHQHKHHHRGQHHGHGGGKKGK